MRLLQLSRAATTRVPRWSCTAALGEFARLGAVRIKFLGGEPLLHHDLPELVANRPRPRHAHRHRHQRLSRPAAHGPHSKQFDEIVISIDGSEAAHDAQRGHGTWKKVMAAIECAPAKALDFFLSAVVTRDTTAEVDWLIDTARKYGVSVNFQIPQFNPEMYGPGAPAVEPAEIRAIVGKIIPAKEAGAPVLFTSRSYGRTLDWEDFSPERVERPGERSPCTAGLLPADGAERRHLSLRAAHRHVQPKNVFRTASRPPGATPNSTPASTATTPG